MTPFDSELEAALQEAFRECDAIGSPLEIRQKQILLQALTRFVAQADSCAIVPPPSSNPNPLDDLTPEQRRLLLHFIQEQNQKKRPWKAQLLNDWLHSRDSGEMQFIRQRYGLQWLEQVQPLHIAQYADEIAMLLQVGERIEVSNCLWEWIQPNDRENQEWFVCTIIGIAEVNEPDANTTRDSYTSCTIRFDNGMEYEIQGVYEWNRYNWRRRTREG
ncbi:hypothetical protein IFO70_05505 [Phormidium tenue FACHB-886]|nr:hypothetical protein [Phormidium tenue FACHB-886]